MKRRAILAMVAGAAMLVGCAGTAVSPSRVAKPLTTWAEVAPHVYLRYERIGEGDSTVVLMHHHAAALETWDDVIPYLASEKRTIVRFDTRGSGLSTKIREPLAFVDLVEDLRSLLDRLQIQGPVVLVGDTVGATVALTFASKYPERTAGVVALGPTSYLEPQPDRLIKFPDPLAPEALAAPTPGRPTADELAAAQKSREAQWNQVYPPVLRADPKRFAKFEGISRSSDPTSAALVMRANYLDGFANVFAKIKSPVVVTAGKYSPRSLESFRELTAAIPGARLVEIESGHFASIQSPEIVGPLVQNFLAELNR
jgi:3-oxoadipate enol-lactonase